MLYKSWPGLTYEQTVFAKRLDLKSLKYIWKRSWMHEDIQGKDTLLLIVGDSWTWGDSILDIYMRSERYDHPDRVKFIYGATLSKLFDADFINVGDGGGNNYDMLFRLRNLLEHNIKKYKKILVAVTMTENGRELTAPTKSVWAGRADTLEEFLINYERKMFTQFKFLFDSYDTVTFLLGRNFTYSFEQNKDVVKNFHLEKTWVDIINKKVNSPYPNDIRFLSNAAIGPLESFLRLHGLFDKVGEGMLLEFDKASKAIEWLSNSPYNHINGTKHPTIEAHDMWANYLYEQFNRRT